MCMRRWLLVVLFFVLLVGVPGRVTAQSITTNTATVNYPQEVTFELEMDSDIVSATLNFDVIQQTCVDVSTQVPVEAESNRAEWTWEMIRSGNPPPGTELWWEWTVVDSSGRETTTPRQTLTFEDDRFNWQTLSAEGVSLHWYEGDVGQLLLDAAVAGLDQLESDMGITLQDDVQLFIYGDSADMRDAVLYIQDWAGGVAFTEYNTILIGVTPSSAESWGVPTVRHELAHLVLAQFTRNCLGGHMPTWLNEGLAVYAEGELSSDWQADIERGIDEDLFDPVRSLAGSFPAHSDEASLAYSQSYSVVEFMLRTYGQEQLQALLLALADGQPYDDALLQVYGFNVDELETQWRADVGATPRTIPPTPTAISANSVPTVPPLVVEQTVATPPSAAGTAEPQDGNPAGSPIPFCSFALFLPLAALWRSQASTGKKAR